MFKMINKDVQSKIDVEETVVKREIQIYIVALFMAGVICTDIQTILYFIQHL